MLKHWIDGQVYISVYAHLVEGSIAVKVGDSVRAGVPLGKMGATGDVTGKHLHFEIYKGKRYTWSADGKNFVDPIEFIKALQVKEALLKAAPLPTPDDAPVLSATKVAVKSAPVLKVVK
jgi:murein DD-endopeptidase MepM/ murein hydrolase activator NlpD